MVKHSGVVFLSIVSSFAMVSKILKCADLELFFFDLLFTKLDLMLKDVERRLRFFDGELAIGLIGLLIFVVVDFLPVLGLPLLSFICFVNLLLLYILPVCFTFQHVHNKAD